MYANVQLLRATDSTLVRGASCDERGRYEIAGVPEGDYLITASYIENASVLRPIQITGDVVLDPILLGEEAQSLDEVVVTSQKPKVERKIDRLVFNIENTAVADGDIWDALKRTPSVSIVNDQLTANGSSSVGILINGRMVHLPKGDILTLLSGTSASDVEAIEVITTPPAKYSAEYPVLINIRKKKNVVAGYNGAVYNKYRQGILPKHTVGTDHYFKGEKTGFSVNYSFSHDRNVVKYTDITNFIENNAITSTWAAEQEILERKKRHNLSAFFDYDLNEKSRLSLSTINVFQPEISKRYDTEATIVGDSLSGFNTLNDSDERQLNSSYYLDFTHELYEKGAEVSFNSHYTYYDYERDQDLNTDFLNEDGNPTGGNDFTTDSDQRIDLFSAQADYSVPLGDASSLETGIRYGGIASESKVAQQGFDREQPGIDPTAAGNFDYDESIYAAYLSYTGKWDAWQLKSGLRAEYTETTGTSDVADRVTKNDYLQLFPSFSIQTTPSEDHKLLMYGYRRIKRPRYAEINPFQVFQSNFATLEGNPNLVPEIKDYLAGGYTFKESYTVEVFYSYDKNPLKTLVFQDNDTRFLRFIPSNMEYSERFGFDLILNKEVTDFWYSYANATFYDQTTAFNDLESNTLVKNNQFNWAIRTSNSFTFLKDGSLTADLTFFYQGPTFFGNERYDGLGSLNLLLRKTLWNKKASISLGVDDIFKQRNQSTSRVFLDQNGFSLRRAENRLLVVGFRYKFGNTKIRDNQKSKKVDERDRL